MLNTYVLNRLNLWATWRMKRFDNGLGYPKKTTFVREISGGFWTPEMDSSCQEIDKCICALIPERKEAVLKMFTMLGTKEQKAKSCGICIRTYDLRLELAFRDILGLLNDLAAGIKI